jgi:hypothetical protein
MERKIQGRRESFSNTIQPLVGVIESLTNVAIFFTQSRPQDLDMDRAWPNCRDRCLKEKYSKALGRTITFQDIPVEPWRAGLLEQGVRIGSGPAPQGYDISGLWRLSCASARRPTVSSPLCSSFVVLALRTGPFVPFTMNMVDLRIAPMHPNLNSRVTYPKKKSARSAISCQQAQLSLGNTGIASDNTSGSPNKNSQPRR